jgi:hypothetical protein
MNIIPNIDVMEMLPIIQIIQAVLEEESSADYWIDLALRRYEELDLERKMALHGSLVKIQQGKRVSQKSRHRARHYARLLERGS